ncbi:MAG TPA: diphthine--ammonia ligase [Bacillaceae bacterium]
MLNRIALSWSGGKDSCMALHELKKAGHDVACLVTTVPTETGRTFAHDEKTERIQAQAEALGIPAEFIHCTFETYTKDFTEQLMDLKLRYELDSIAFGDMYLEGHREWGESLAQAAGLTSLYPIWGEEHESMDGLKRFIHTGYKAEVMRVRKDALPESWVGRLLDESFIRDIAKKPVCPMGESGEYHTFVFDGPLFRHPVQR